MRGSSAAGYAGTIERTWPLAGRDEELREVTTSIRPGGAAETIARALDQLAATDRFVLVVDDAHLLDEHSAIVLHRVVVRRLAPVLVTLRSGEPAPDVVTALWKDEHLPRLDLGPHLYRAGLKLGVSERTTLKDVLGLE